jgi:hypothetical protein
MNPEEMSCRHFFMGREKEGSHAEGVRSRKERGWL